MNNPDQGHFTFYVRELKRYTSLLPDWIYRFSVQDKKSQKPFKSNRDKLRVLRLGNPGKAARSVALPGLI